MEIALFNKNGDAVAYIADDYDRTIYFWDGQQVAYLFNERLIYGTNGKHLGWYIDGVIFNPTGERIGFKASTCPVPPSMVHYSKRKPGRGIPARVEVLGQVSG